jgi:hypothetical protein
MTISLAPKIKMLRTTINASTNRTSWTANNAIPDSIIMNMICRNLLPSAEPKVCSTEVGLNLMTLRILNTIMPVTRVFTVMDAAKPVINNVFGVPGRAYAIQVARSDKLKSAYQMKID